MTKNIRKDIPRSTKLQIPTFCGCPMLARKTIIYLTIKPENRYLRDSLSILSENWYKHTLIYWCIYHFAETPFKSNNIKTLIHSNIFSFSLNHLNWHRNQFKIHFFFYSLPFNLSIILSTLYLKPHYIYWKKKLQKVNSIYPQTEEHQQEYIRNIIKTANINFCCLVPIPPSNMRRGI